MLLTRRQSGFSERDRSLFASLASQLSMGMENARLYHQLDGLFRAYMSPDVATALLADPEQAALGGAVVEVTALFADLRGFTSFSERSTPEEIVVMLNRYFEHATAAILDEGGTVVQFVGDALMALFNAPARQHDHPVRAARAALAMQAAVEATAASSPGWPRFRVGINTGPALVGNIGSTALRSFNAMGDAVNVAARLESVAQPGQVVIGESTRARLPAGAAVESLGELAVKGRRSAVVAYRLFGLHEPHEPSCVEVPVRTGSTACSARPFPRTLRSMSRSSHVRPLCDRPCAGLCRPEGFAAAHRGNRAWLLARARALLGDPGAAEDAVQETFLRAWAACRTFDPSAGPTLATWLGTIGRNVAVDMLRARSVRPRLAPESDDATDRADAGAGVDGAVDTALQRMVLLDALSQVSPEHRGVVLLAVVRDRPYADVAAALDIPVGTVKSRVHHALRGMRRSLGHPSLDRLPISTRDQHCRDRTVLAA